MLLEVEEARRRMLAALSPLSDEMVPLESGLGRILAEAVYSELDLPPFSNSSMDGFAVRAEELVEAGGSTPVSLAVVGDIPAGVLADRPLLPGEAMRIMTGAPLPGGADAVIPVEDTDFQDHQPGSPAPEQVRIYRAVRSGDYVRASGEDLRAGQQVFQAGHRLRPQDLGMLATLGRSTVRVVRKPKVALLSTGDELAPLEAPLEAGMIYESNSYTLAAQVTGCGCEALRLGIVRDEEAAVRQRLNQAVEREVDLIITSAGVSVGAYDFVRMVIEADGNLEFWRVNMRPGKPLAFGSYRGVPLIGLPGNPVSAFVGFEVFARPALFWLMGQMDWHRESTTAVLLERVESDGRESYLRGMVRQEAGVLVARLTGHQGSGNIFSLVQANALLVVPAGVRELPPKAEITAWLLD